jgi:AbrB family looped-hinge helix DNA binding protein
VSAHKKGEKDMKYVTNEGVSRKMDSAGRISIPKHLRDKYNCNPGDEFQFFTRESSDGGVFLSIYLEPNENNGN